MKSSENIDTIVSPITSTSTGSIALIRISGDNAISATEKLFPAKKLSASQGGCFYYGKLKSSLGALIDDVIVYVFRKPFSFTGEDVIEISCHANPFIVDEIISLFLMDGCRMAEPGEFSKRAFLNGKIDLLQAEAVADVIASKSKASTKSSLKQLEGSLSHKINSLKDELIRIAGMLELELDFSEEDLEIVSREKCITVLDDSIKIINSLIESYEKGKNLLNGVEVLITGKPNVGKSSLMNALLNKDRVIVSNIPGTTRDLISENIIVENTLVKLIDTAGIRFTDDYIEAAGVSKTRELFTNSDLIMIVIDISQELDTEDISLVDTLSMHKEKLFLVGNKIDLGQNEKTAHFIKESNLPVVLISAKQQENIDSIGNRIKTMIFENERFLQEDAIITNQRQKNSLDRINQALSNARDSVLMRQGLEFIAIDIRVAIDNLSELTGEITSDDILNSIFANFCIGK